MAVAMAGVALLARLLAGHVLAAASGAPGPSIWEEARAAQYVDDARLAAESYKLEHGAYPKSLADVPGWQSPPTGAPSAADPRGMSAILEEQLP